VRELCEAAEITRATFYAHYADVYDLLQQMENTAVSRLTGALEGASEQTFMSLLFAHVATETAVWQLLLNENGRLCFQQNVTEVLTPYVSPLFPAALAVHFAVGGVIGILRRWLQDGCLLPADEIAVLTMRYLQMLSA